MKLAAGKKRLVVLVLAIFLIAAVAATAALGNLGAPSLPSGAVAYVQDGGPNPTVTQEEFDTQMEISAYQSGVDLSDLIEDDPQYEQVRSNAVLTLIQSRWIRGEAEERGLAPSEREIDIRVEEIKNTQFEGEDGFEEFLEESPYTEESAREFIALGLYSERVQADAMPTDPAAAPEVTNADIRLFYERNEQMFEQPESRDVRIIANESEDDINAAKEIIDGDGSEDGWREAAEEYGTDESTVEAGALRPGITRGTNLEEVDNRIFDAPAGELVGPFEVNGAWHLIKVENINEASKQTIDEAQESIRAQIQQSLQGFVGSRFNEEFMAKWKNRTVCGDDYLVYLCGNYVDPNDGCAIDDPGERQGLDAAQLSAGCEAWVQQRPHVQAGNTYLPPGSLPSAGANCAPPLGHGQTCFTGPHAIPPVPEGLEGHSEALMPIDPNTGQPVTQ